MIITKKGISLDEIQVEVEKRIDQIISEKLQISRSKALNLIKNKNVFLQDAIIEKASFVPVVGQVIKVQKEVLEEKQTQNLDIDIEILYEDDDIMVLNKPTNLAVHPAKSLKEPSLVEWLLSKNYKLSNLGEALRPGIVHRLDKPTSGGLIIAKNNESHLNLSAQFKSQSVGRYYLATLNLPLKENLVIDKPIGRNPKNLFATKENLFELASEKVGEQTVFTIKPYI